VARWLEFGSADVVRVCALPRVCPAISAIRLEVMLRVSRVRFIVTIDLVGNVITAQMYIYRLFIRRKCLSMSLVLLVSMFCPRVND
jgi:hypothetical protein